MTLQTTKPISMADIEAEFSAPSGTPLSAFVAGGAFVPDGTTGVGGPVPTAKPIAMTDLLGSASVPTFPLVMTAGLDGGGAPNTDDSGYATAQYGTLVPDQVRSETVSVIKFGFQTQGDELTIDFAWGSEQGQDFWTQLTIDGTNWTSEVFLSVNADDFGENSGLGRWIFLLPSHAPFSNSNVYNCTFTTP